MSEDGGAGTTVAPVLQPGCSTHHESMRTDFAMTARRLAGSFAALVMVAAFGLTGCKPDNTPKAYGILTQQNFLELCTNMYVTNTNDSLSITSSSIAANIDAPTENQCQCQYDVFVSQVPINSKDTSKPGYDGPNITDLNASLKKDPQKAWDSLPASVTDALSGCMNTGGGQAPVTTTVPTTNATETTLP